LGDVNGDGREDIIGFAGNGAYVSLASVNGTFGSMTLASSQFGANGWSSQNTVPRLVGDVNGDGRADVVGFAQNDVEVALGQADGTFLYLGQVATGFGTGANWTNQDATPRQLADINGDGCADIVGFGTNSVSVMEGQGDGRFGPQYVIGSQFVGGGWMSQDQTPRLLGDVDGDGAADIVGFAGAATTVSLTTFNRDTLSGGDGNDTLDGGRAADLLDGGAGIDAASYAGASAGVRIDLATGLGAAGDAKGDALVSIENLEGGRGNDTLWGNAGGNLLSGGLGQDLAYGRDGADTLDGGTGADTLLGGTGNDLYVVDDIGDAIVENTGEGTDEVRTALSVYTLAANVELLTYTGTGPFTATGNAQNNRLAGAGGADSLSGLAGNDTLIGGAGADTLDGGTGTDTASYASATVGVVVNLTAGAGTTGDASGDVLIAIENLTGSVFADALTGDGAANRLDGGAGADTLIGAAGNDSYVVDNVGDVVIEQPGEGTDTVSSSIAYTLLADFENLTLTGSATTGTGNAANNALTGTGAANLLVGLDGADTLNGNGGADTLVGGIGSDFYYVDNAGDVVTEAVDEGADAISASVSHALADNVEALVLSGSAAIDGTGNALDNTLTGNTGANRLDGGLGADTLSGGAGADTLQGGLGADSLAGGTGDDVYLVVDADMVTESAGQGSDEVRTALTAYSLGADVEALTYTGVDTFTGTGNALANRLTGGTGVDSLTGGDGADTLDGGAGGDCLAGGLGDDVYLVDSADDLVAELAGEGVDEVRTTLASYTLTDAVERLLFTGSGGFAGTGNGLDNRLEGGSGTDTLSGGAGADTLLGADGDDMLSGGTGADLFVFAAGGGQDTLTDFDAAQGDRLGLSGGLTYTVAANGAGNAVITFSSGDTLTLLGVQSSAVQSAWFIAL